MYSRVLLLCLIATTMAARMTGRRQVESSNQLGAASSEGTYASNSTVGAQKALTASSTQEVTNSSWFGRKKLPFCHDAACCKAKAKSADDMQTCEEFYDRNVGIAFQMVSPFKWGSFALPNGHFHDSPPTERLTGDHQQCVSVAHSGKTPCPYSGAQAAWGMVLSVGKRSNFWKYFQECWAGQITGQCNDGYKCAPHTRTPLVNTGWTFEQFVQAKNAIVEQTGTDRCHLKGAHQYNEFDTNGFSNSAVAGIIVPQCLKRFSRPTSFTACRALNKINGQKRHWPVFAYKYQGGSSSLYIKSYLNCWSIRAR